MNVCGLEFENSFLGLTNLSYVHPNKDKCFGDAQLRILHARFLKSHSIDRYEAEELAKTLKVKPERIMRWFTRIRNTGGIQQPRRSNEGTHCTCTSVIS